MKARHRPRLGTRFGVWALGAVAVIPLHGCRLHERPTGSSAERASARADGSARPEASPDAGATFCPDEGASPGCCYGDNICGIQLNRVCYPRAALVLDARGCDGGAPGPFARGTSDAGD